MPRYEGTVKRTRPRVNVMRGYTGNEPQSLSRSAPVASGVTIKSGQAIALDGNEEWILASTEAVVYIAYHDSDDTDVKSCGKLLGFSTLGQYELETAYTETAGLAAANGSDLEVVVGTTPGSLSINGTADAGGPVLGRTSCAAVDLSNSQRGGYAVNLGEDDSSGAWGSSGSATACDIDIDVTGQAGDAADTFTITFTGVSGTFVTPTITYGGSAAAGSTNIKAGIDALQLSDATFDGLIASTTDDSAGTVAVVSHAGAVGHLVATVQAVSDADTDLDVVVTANADGADATSTTSKQVLRWVTTAS